MSKLVVTNIETQNIKFDSDTTAFTIASDGTTTGTGANKKVILANNTTGGTGLTEIAFDLSMDTTYLYQLFIIEEVYSAAVADLHLRTRRASDNSYFTGSNSYAYAYKYTSSSGTGGSGSQGQTYARICGHPPGNVASESSTWRIRVFNNAASGTGRYTRFFWDRVGYEGGTPKLIQEEGGIIELATTTTNQFKIYGGNGDSVSFSGYVHYGIKRS